MLLIEKHSESLKHLISQEKMTTHQFILLCYCNVFGCISGTSISYAYKKNCIGWHQRAILWTQCRVKSMVCGGGTCEWDKWSCPRKAWMRPWKPYLNLVSTKFSLQKWSSEPAVYVSTMRQCFASEYFFEASKKHTCGICEHGQTPFEERDNLNISQPGVEAKIHHHLLETFFASSSHYTYKCKI